MNAISVLPGLVMLMIPRHFVFEPRLFYLFYVRADLGFNFLAKVITALGDSETKIEASLEPEAESIASE